MAARDSGSDPCPGERVAADRFLRLHVLGILFPDLDGDAFLLGQLLASIESAMRENGEDCADFDRFAANAVRLRQQDPMADADDFTLITIDFAERAWDPLFVQAELVRRLKSIAGRPHVLLRIRNLSDAMFPGGAYRTRSRANALKAAREALGELVAHWTARNTRLHLVFD